MTFGAVKTIEAELFARLPTAFHYKGEPTEWVRVTRPGQRLHSFLESPCFDKEGRLWLVDVPYGRIFRIERDGNWTLAYSYDGEPHAIRPLGERQYLVADYRRGLLKYHDGDGVLDPVCTSINSEPFRGLSDLFIAANGDAWFTDPGRTSLSDPTGRLFRYRAGTGRLDLVLANVPYPNGVALSPDGRFVYLAATRANAVWRLLADAPDPVFPMAGIFIQLSGGLGPDGLAVDRQGRIAVAQGQAGRAYLFNALGDPLAVIHTPGGLWTTACAFGDDDRALYIVEAQTGAVYRAAVDAIG